MKLNNAGRSHPVIINTADEIKYVGCILIFSNHYLSHKRGGAQFHASTLLWEGGVQNLLRPLSEI